MAIKIRTKLPKPKVIFFAITLFILNINDPWGEP